eukprot:CAMPEP_0195088466 /NCGR_PEP_ID=MMETSP0448-20130528/28030_1 /TAXON_ID=66468 /ORGANISM="Heterocapsa triquestra, Strain CCMP 448" /LENGTH=68 /DNA_ID=CAMNT_0040122121 /DNA_START=64 /DNA_END=267 /DNA_ORIENTATION=+
MSSVQPSSDQAGWSGVVEFAQWETCACPRARIGRASARVARCVSHGTGRGAPSNVTVSTCATQAGTSR